MIITSLGFGIGAMKAGLLGFAGSGKTRTAIELAIGLWKTLGLKGPIAMFDTEKAAQYVAPIVRRETGMDLIGCQSRSFDDAVAFYHEAVKMGASVLVYDSVTHIWQDLGKCYLKQRNEVRMSTGKPASNRLEFGDWSVIKGKWATFADLYLNSPEHVIICGRAGYEWDFEDREDGTGKDLVKTGIKMKTEGDFGFEPSLLIQMERVQLQAEEMANRREALRAKGSKDMSTANKITSAQYVRRATVIKDRFGVIDGLSCDDPTFDFFKPYVDCLVPGANPVMDINLKTDMGIGDDGEAKLARERRRRTIACENLQGLLLREWPGMGAQEKLARQEVVWKLLETRAWTEVETTNADRLEAAIMGFPAAVAEVKAELAKRAADEADAEAKAKAEKKSPKKATEVSA